MSAEINLSPAIQTAIENTDRLLDDAELLLDSERYPSAYALAVLAQEEYAKAFLLCLVVDKALHWDRNVQRAIRDHTCKQLLGILIEYLNIEDLVYARPGYPASLPTKVNDALHIFVHEKIARRRTDEWLLEDDKIKLDPYARGIADGKLDRQKQNALYTRLGFTGVVIATPVTCTKDAAAKEFERAQRVKEFFRRDLTEPWTRGLFEYEKVTVVLRLLSGLISVEEYNNLWWVQQG
jgi:AbiV family abortive infection protein